MAVYNRGGIYYYSVSINGKNVRRSTGQRTLKEALEFERNVKASIQKSDIAKAAIHHSSTESNSDWAKTIRDELKKSGGGLVGLFCRRAKGRAKDMKKEFMLDYDTLCLLMIDCGGRCAVTGMPLSFSGATYSRPSIDRIDSSRGYTLDNIRITSVIANLSMNKWGESALRTMCGYFAHKLFTRDSA